jgi:NTE family protein
MLAPTDLSLFSDLDVDGRRLLESRAERREVRAGQVVLRRGARGRELLGVASGGLEVDVGSAQVPIAPGEVVGEMSLLSGLPVSATVTAVRPSVLWALPSKDFLALLEDQDGLRARITDLLVRRLREREHERGSRGPQVALVGLPEDRELGAAWLDLLQRAVARHLPRVQVVRPGDPEDARREVESWRDAAVHGELLLVALPDSGLPKLAGLPGKGDAVVRQFEGGDPAATVGLANWGLADLATVRRTDGEAPGPLDRWAHGLDPQELERCADGSPPTRARTPRIDRLARWLAGRQVGLALSAGAALGFAHLGVIAELEALGLPIDHIAGTSMGGVAGLMYGLAGDGEGGIEKCVWTLGRKTSRRVSLLPRASLLSDRELRKRGETIGEGRSLADLSLPVSVVSCDLVRGQRVVVDRGLVADAFFSTSAVPGVLPPVREGNRVLVDGALLSRLPVDLLPRSRCAVRIGVNVIPAPDSGQDAAPAAAELLRRMDKPFGFVHALTRSWELIGWAHGARDAADADVLLEPATAEHSGLAFATSWPALVEAGRQVVREHADELRAAARDVLADEDDD